MTGLSMGTLWRAYQLARAYLQVALADLDSTNTSDRDLFTSRYSIVERRDRQTGRFGRALGMKIHSAEQPRTCAGCQWWEARDRLEDAWGVCGLATVHGSDFAHEDTKAASWCPGGELDTELETLGGFGCNQWEAKE